MDLPNHGFWSLALSITVLQDFLQRPFLIFCRAGIGFEQFEIFLEWGQNRSYLWLVSVGFLLYLNVSQRTILFWPPLKLYSYLCLYLKMCLNVSIHDYNKRRHWIISIHLWLVLLSSPKWVLVKSDWLKIHICIATFSLQMKRFNWIENLKQNLYNIDCLDYFRINERKRTETIRMWIFTPYSI